MEDENVGEAKLTAYTNIYGDTVNAVIYEGEDSDMIFYPTRAGIKSEMVFHNGYKENKVKFIVYSNAINYRNKENGYITFEKGGKSQSIIYQPLVQYSTQKDGAFGVDTEMKIRKEGDGFVVEMLFDGKTNTQTVVKMDPSFELYLNKMPDTSVYSRFNKNSYLRHYAVVGEHPELGEGWEFIRLRINYFMTLNPGALLDASYNIRVLASSNPSYALTAYEAEEQWSSTGLLWSNKRQPQSIFATAKGKHAQYISFNMKDYVAECLQDPDWLKESVGFVLKQDNAGYTILASSDNVLYSPYLKMTLKDLPVYFDAQDNINETQY